MKVFCCLCEDRHLLVGVPPAIDWVLTGTPCDRGTVLTLQIKGTENVQLFGGNPVNLQEQVIEIKDFAVACSDFIGSAAYLDIKSLGNNITYFEIGRPHEEASSEKAIDYKEKPVHSYPKREWHGDGNAFYKWSKILRYLDDHLGKVAVEAWFDQATVTEFTDQLLKIDAGNAFRCAIIHRRCLNLIQDALWELYGSKAVVEVFSSVE